MDHTQGVGGVTELRIGSERRLAPARADRRGGKHGRAGDQPQGAVEIVPIGQPRHQGPDDIDGRERGKSGVQGRDMVEHLFARQAQPAAEPGDIREVGEQAVQQDVRGLLESDVSGQFHQGVAADHQPSGGAIYVRQHGLGGHDIIQSVHSHAPLRPEMESLRMIVNLDQ